jgi:formimidoylglutamase
VPKGGNHYPYNMVLPHDPLWPRASSLFNENPEGSYDLALVGVPASRTSISPSGAHNTPAAIRAALARYSIAHSNSQVDLSTVQIHDAGDVSTPDDNEQRCIEEISHIARRVKSFIALGGDNSITYSGFQASGATGLITFDAHYDLRDGVSNGSPVRRLIEAGLNGKNVVQIGIADFSNSPEYAKRAADFGITVIPRSELRIQNTADIWKRALSIAGDCVYVDFDMDICDRSIVPACPAAAPGGISADEIRQFAFHAGQSLAVRAIDITEIDSTIDSQDQRTIRLAALVVLEFVAGLSTRP